ncbi:MAG: hypothetical protein RQ761_08200 [Bacteroidales bacterium]|nr:hypothetical protein [Bacteroidales bacterium]
MKIRKSLSASIIALLVLLITGSACQKEEENTIMPSITIYKEAGYVSTDTSMMAGEEIRLKIMLKGGDFNITNFVIEVLSEGSEKIYFDTGMNTSSVLWHGSFLKSSAPSERWQFKLSDREGNSALAGFTITLDTGNSYRPLISYASTVLGAQENEQTGGCLDIIGPAAYFHHEVAVDVILQEKTDILYYYFGDDENTIASPGANIEDEVFTVNPANWTIVNTTRYIKTSLSANDFDNALNDSIILANYNEGDAKRKAKNLRANDIYTFRTHDGKLGMFHVNEVTGTTDGSININIKIQE